jgi:predicted double-glycine peptidase
MGRFVRARTRLGFCALLGAALAGGTGSASADADPTADHGVQGTSVGYIRPGLGFPGLDAALGQFGFPRGLQPLSEQRWEGVVRQRVDAGCGPASLATLYTYYLDLPVTEEAMARAVTAEALRQGRGRVDIQRRGYTLGDLKRVADRARLITAAFGSTVENLAELRIPVVTQINIRGYGHFVVLRGTVGDRVVIADPNFGNMTLLKGQFRDMWSGVMLAVGRPKGPMQRPEFDPRGGPVSHELDYSTFRRGPALPARSTKLATFIGFSAKFNLGNFVIGGLQDFHPFGFERSAIQLNLD